MVFSDLNITLTCGFELLIAGFPGETLPKVMQFRAAALTTRSEVTATWCDEEGRLRESSLPVFVDGEHTRYRQGLQTERKDGDAPEISLDREP